MARPGFNRLRWSEMTIPERIFFAWIGKQRETTVPLSDFQGFCHSFGSKVCAFAGLTPDATQAALEELSEQDGLAAAAESLGARAGFLAEFAVGDDGDRLVRFALDERRVQEDVDSLRAAGVHTIISLLEDDFANDRLRKDFQVLHFPVDDLSPPRREQAIEFAAVFHRLRGAGHTVVVHCLAGVGRTTTMLIAAHLLRGMPLQGIVERCTARNPAFVFAGRQADFLRELAAEIGA